MNGIDFGQSSHVRYIKSQRSIDDLLHHRREIRTQRGEVQLLIEDIQPI